MPTVVIGDNTGDDFSGTEDAMVKNFSTRVGFNYGGSTLLEITKYTATPDHAHSLIRFTGISNLPSSITVSSASVSLYLNGGGGSKTHILTMKRLLRTWTENTLNGTTGDASNNNYSIGNAWTTGGGLSDGNDRSATVSDTILANNTFNEYKTSADIAQLRTDIENFASGANTNDGWHFERTDDQDDTQYRDFTSSEGTDGQRPYLTIVYTTGAGFQSAWANRATTVQSLQGMS